MFYISSGYNGAKSLVFFSRVFITFSASSIPPSPPFAHTSDSANSQDGINTVKKDWFKRREIVKRKWNGININGASGNRNPGYIG